MKILIATATAGGGHLAAAAALEEAWEKFRPGDTVRRVDILDFTPKLYRKAYAEGYAKLADKAPELYAHAFRLTDTAAFAARMTGLRRLSARLMAGKFLKLVREFKPKAVLCPHFMPLEAMGSWTGGRKPKVICIVTDFEAHALWMESGVDLYCVATEATRARLAARGISPDEIRVTGIPVSRRFSQSMNAAVLRRGLKLDPALSTLLLLGGGLGMGPMVETLAAIDRARHRFQVIAVAGKNEKLREKLSARRYKHPVRILGFATNMHELMAASDLIVTKPGGLTSSEAMALGKPLLIVNPLPGQEAANSDFLLEQGAAAKVNRLEDLPYKIPTLLEARKLAAMARAAKRIGRPRAAAVICRRVLAYLDGKRPSR